MGRYNRRCRHFDDNKQPIGAGCQRQYCPFAHPEDSKWDTSVSTCDIRYRNEQYSPRTSYRSRRDWQGSRRSSPSRSRSRSPGHKRHTRKDSISSSVASEAGPSRTADDSQFPPSPSKATTADTQSYRSAERSGATASGSAVPLPTPPTSSKDPNKTFSFGPPPAAGTPRVQAQAQVLSGTITASPIRMSPSDFPIMPPTEPKAFRIASGAINNSSSAPPPPRASTSHRQSPAEMASTPTPPPPAISRPRPPLPAAAAPPPPPPPPQPAHPAPMQPPQPLPEIPSGLTAGSASPVVDLDIKSQMNLWDTRTKALSKYLEAYLKLTTAEENHTKASQILQMPNFLLLPDSDKAIFKEKFDALTSQLDDTRKQHEAARLEILNTGTWPVLPPEATNLANIEEEMIEKQADILRFVKELHGMASEMVKLLGDIASPPPPPDPLFLATSDDEDEEGGVGSGWGMDVDQPEGSSAIPKKKRRDKGKGKARREIDPAQAAEISRQEKKILTDKLVNFEDRITVLFNELDVTENDRKEVFKEMIDLRLEEVQQGFEQENRQWKERQREREANANNVINEVQGLARATDSDVAHLSEEMAKMMKEADELAQEIEKEQLARDQALERLSRVEQRLEEYSRINQSHEETINTLKSTINAHLNRPPSPPRSPIVPSTEIIISTIEQNVTDSLRKSMVPMIEEFRVGMENLVDKSGMDIYRNMWTTVNPTMEILKRIEDKIAASASGAGAGARPGQSSAMVVDQVPPVQNQP